MALYPIIEPELAENRRYDIPSGTCYAFPVDISDGESKKIIIMHTDISQQDHSLRAWVSNEIGDGELIHYPLETAIWHPNRTPHHVVAVVEKTATIPEDVAAFIPVEAGTYFFHVLNLTNKQNSFFYYLDETV